MYVLPWRYARHLYVDPFDRYDRHLRSGTFAGMGHYPSAMPVDPRSSPVYSNTHRLVTAGALNRVGALGTVDVAGNLGLYMVALAIPAVVAMVLFGLGVIKVD